MKAASMKDLYVRELQDIYNAQLQELRALPRIADGVRSAELAAAFAESLRQTREQMKRLETILTGLGQKVGGVKCPAMSGLIQEVDEVLRADGDDGVRDAGVIMEAQKVAHYEIAAYGCLHAIARLLGRDEDAQLLDKSLREEKAIDAVLTDLAMRRVNSAAAM